MNQITEFEMTSDNQNYWCFSCQTKVQTQENQDQSAICKQRSPPYHCYLGLRCGGCFVEAIESEYDDSEMRPEMYQPYKYSENSVADNENTIEALSLENNVSQKSQSELSVRFRVSATHPGEFSQPNCKTSFKIVTWLLSKHRESLRSCLWKEQLVGVAGPVKGLQRELYQARLYRTMSYSEQLWTWPYNA